VTARKALGKGIAAIIPEAPPVRGEKISTLPLTQVYPSPNQPRRSMNSQAISELAESIRGSGVLQPILVRRTGSGFELVAGERRWRAARKAGLKEIPAIIRELKDAEALELSLIENIQREDLNPIEEAQGYARLIEEFSYSQESVAKKVGKDRVTVTNALRLLKLPDEVRKEISRGTMTAGHGRALLALEGAAAQREAARLVRSRGLSVRATEELVRKLKKKKRKTAPPLTPLEAQIRRVVEDLKRKLRVRVEIKSLGKGGRVILYYSSEEELTALVDTLLT